MADWNVIRTEQGEKSTDKGKLYFVKVYVSDDLSLNTQISDPNLPASALSGYTISIIKSSQAFTPFETDDGRIKAYYDSNSGYYTVDFYDGQGNLVSSNRMGTSLSNYGTLCWAVLIDPNGNAVLKPAPFFVSSSNMLRLSYNTATAFGAVNVNRAWTESGAFLVSQEYLDQGAAVLGELPIVYNWKAWDQIAGNGGQYRCDLTKIKNNSIGDFTAIQTGDVSDFDRTTPQSSIWNIYHNMALDETRTIAWSGANYMTMTVTKDPTQSTYRYCTFKLYNIVTVGGVQTPTLIHQYTQTIYAGSYHNTECYLSFIYDSDEQVAVFVPVTKDSNGVYRWGWSGGLPTDVTMNNIYTWLHGSDNPGNVTPYSTGTEDNGGDPGGNLPQSHIDVPTPPDLGAMSSGMFTLYCPTETELSHIATLLWSDAFITNIKKYFNNVSDNIMALYVLPCKPTNNPNKVFQVGNYTTDDPDLYAIEYVDDRFLSIDMGSITIRPYWGSYLDYAPYSSLQVVLPGVGIQSLDVDDIFCPADQNGNLPTPGSTTIHIDYTIDLMTGVLVAFVSINGEMRYQFPGKIGYQIPLTGDNYVRMAQGFVTATAGLIGTVASGGAAAPFTAPAAAAGIINAMKPEVYRGGNLSGDASMLARLTPTLIYRRPNKPLLLGQEEFTGFPSYKIGLLSEFSGYTEVLDAHVEGISCTEEERDQILALLKGGVII